MPTQNPSEALNQTIAVGGENLIDLVEVSINDGIPQYAALPGGGPFNIAIAAARQGCDVDYLTPISKDRLGKLIAARLHDSGVNLASAMSDAPTSLAVVSLEDGQPAYAFYRTNTAERQVSSSQFAEYLINPPWAFHVGSLALSEGQDAEDWEAMFMACQRKGVITSLDPNVRAALIPDPDAYRARIERMIPKADIIKLSDEDITWLFPKNSLEESFAHLCKIAGDALVILTMGAEGSIAKSGLAEVKCPSHLTPELIDTVGAGDTFMASILAWLKGNAIWEGQDVTSLDEEKLMAMLKRASLASSINCTRQGCNPPRLDELNAAS